MGNTKSKSQLSPVRRVILKQFFDNSVFVTASNPKLTISELTIDQFKAVLDKKIAGYVVNTFSDSEEYPFFIYYPAVFVKYFEHLYRNTHVESNRGRDDGDYGVTIDCLFHMTGNLPRLFYFTEKDDPVGKGYELVPFFTLPKGFSPEDGEELLWRSYDCVIFQVRIDKYPLFLVIHRDLYKRIDSRLRKDPSFVTVVKDLVLSRETELGIQEQESLESVTIAINKPEDFFLGEFVLPFKCVCNEKEVDITFLEMSIGKNIEEFVRVKGYHSRIVFADSQEYSFFYSAEREIKPLLSCLLRGVGSFYQKKLGVKVKGIALGESGDLSNLTGDIVVFKTGVKVLSFEFTLFVMCEEDMFIRLLGRFLDPWEIEFLKRNLKNRLLSLISLNQALTRKNPGRLSKGDRRPNKGTDSGSELDRFLKVSALLNISPPDDIKRIVGRVGFEIISPALFYYSDGEEDSPLFKIADYDEEQLFEYLPQAVRDEWAYRMRQGHSGSYDELLRLNVAFMLQLAKMVYRKDIELGHNTKAMVTSFYREYEKYFMNHIWEWEKEHDVFALLGRVHKRRMQSFLSGLENRFLCLSLFGNEDRFDQFRPFMSKFYFTDIQEQLGFFKDRYELKDFFVDDIFEAKKKFYQEIKFLTAIDDVEE